MNLKNTHCHPHWVGMSWMTVKNWPILLINMFSLKNNNLRAFLYMSREHEDRLRTLKPILLKCSYFLIVRHFLLQLVMLQMPLRAPDGLITVNELKWLWQFLNLHKAVHASAEMMKTIQTCLEFHSEKLSKSPTKVGCPLCSGCVCGAIKKGLSGVLGNAVCFYTNKKKERHQNAGRLEDWT